jgi:hypothetical protein
MKRIIATLAFIFFLVGLIALAADFGPTVSAGTEVPGQEASEPVGVDKSGASPFPTISVVATPTRTPVPFPSGTPVCGNTWYVVDSPNVGESANELYGIDGVGSNDLWSVGFYLAGPGEGTSYKRAHKPAEWQERLEGGVSGLGREPDGSSPAIQTLIEHWDGALWSVVPSPNVGTDDNHLLSIDVIGASDAWAVGYYLNEFGIAQTLALHWDGVSWVRVATPNTTPYQDNEILSVEGASGGDVWAVGYSVDDAGLGHTLTMHWDGTQWSIVASPDPAGAEAGAALRELAVVGPSDVWAVGFYISGNGILRTLALRWDGAQWSIVSTPNVGSRASFFYSVDAAGPNDVWAVGYYISNDYEYRPLAEHWDGTQWTVVLVPTLASETHVLYWVDVLSATDVWAVGTWGGYSYSPQSFIAHWDGQAWEAMEGPEFGPYTYNVLQGVKVVSPGDVWAVGRAFGGFYGVPRTYVAHYGDVLTTCDRQFTDVPPGSTYYEAVRYLACRGVLGGYACGGVGEPCDPQSNPYFRPGAGVTRGQLAKIVANAAGFNEDPGPAIFADVYYEHPYYPYVNRLAWRGIVSGYLCGAPDEPCYPYYPQYYFRPNAPATRGQIAKIVAEAKGYTGQPTTQTFQDVPPSHTYYKWVENLATVGAMTGYACGGPGEPCVPPGNKPYFRPGNNATRGQTAKIVAVTFYPGCSLGR